ncbi:hypothetical protein HDU97_002620 [Phlyctochytrium planicorne]|nr:hypothetical protein HDU97_002620 [Phlyctochytrium planicorne]
MSDYSSSNSTVTSTSYTEINLLTNAFRSLCIGYAISVITTCAILMNFVNRKAALLPILSAVFLICCLFPAITIDLVRPASDLSNVNACKGRALAIYIFSYLSQICLEIYQTNKIRILAHRDRVCRYLAYALFGLRVASIAINLAFYRDIKDANGTCSTGFPFMNLLAEKLILLFYNLGNIFILVYIVKKGASNGIAFKSVTSFFLYQDGLTFSLAVILDAIYISVLASFTNTPWIMSMAAGLANGFNMFILHVKYCVSLSLRVRGLPTSGTGGSGNGRRRTAPAGPQRHNPQNSWGESTDNDASIPAPPDMYYPKESPQHMRSFQSEGTHPF